MVSADRFTHPAVYVLLSDAGTARRLMKKTFFWSEASSVEARIGRARSNPFERVIERTP